MAVGALPPAGAPRRTGLLGGSFDPVHNAHLALATTARRHLQLDTVQLLPAAAPWQREPLGAAAIHRVAMLEAAVAGLPGIEVNTVEVARGGPTYTVDPLRALGAGDEPQHTYYWVLGSDQLVNFCTWHQWDEIARRVRLAVAVRPGSQLSPPAELAALLATLSSPLLPLPMAPIEISATDIRRRVAAGQSIDGLTPPAVADYIQTHHLYRA